MDELLKAKQTLESIQETDNVSLDVLDEINSILDYMRGWCAGWLVANK